MVIHICKGTDLRYRLRQHAGDVLRRENLRDVPTHRLAHGIEAIGQRLRDLFDELLVQNTEDSKSMSEQPHPHLKQRNKQIRRKTFSQGDGKMDITAVHFSLNLPPKICHIQTEMDSTYFCITLVSCGTLVFAVSSRIQLAMVLPIFYLPFTHRPLGEQGTEVDTEPQGSQVDTNVSPHGKYWQCC